MNYYNEFNPKTAHILRQLIADGLIPKGDVDERSIADVKPGDLRGYTQCHFFAGIGGWSLALQLASWPETRQVWTGSCPCQPFSPVGTKSGLSDERHVWPEFYRLIKECRPDVVFGEQVSDAIEFGWLDGVCADLESEDYSCGSQVLGAHSVGAPQQRQRLYWVADSNRAIVPGETRELWYDGLPDVLPPAANCWQGSDAGAITCGDGKRRRLEPGLRGLVDGFPGYLAFFHGFGNAICPQTGAAFIIASANTARELAATGGTN